LRLHISGVLWSKKNTLFTRNSSKFLILRLHATLGKWERWEEGGRGKRGEGRDREEEEEGLFVFNDTIEGPRAPAIKPGRVAPA